MAKATRGWGQKSELAEAVAETSKSVLLIKSEGSSNLKCDSLINLKARALNSRISQWIEEPKNSIPLSTRAALGFFHLIRPEESLTCVGRTSPKMPKSQDAPWNHGTDEKFNMFSIKQTKISRLYLPLFFMHIAEKQTKRKSAIQIVILTMKMDDMEVKKIPPFPFLEGLSISR